MMVCAQVDVNVLIDNAPLSVSQNSFQNALPDNVIPISYNDANVTLIAQICPVGYYCPFNTTSPQACPAGSQCPTSNLSIFSLCPVGSYQPQTGQSSCIACPAGSQCPNTSLITFTLCPVGTYQSQTGQSSCLDCPLGRYCPLVGTITPSNCSIGTFRGVTNGVSQADCSPCALGTYDPITSGRTSNCALCPVNSYCISPVTISRCPINTVSLPGASSQLGCTCLPGYTCSYTKRITAVVTLNASLSDFDDDVKNIKTSFIAAIAAAAGVATSQVTIKNVVQHGAGRRLLAVGIDVHMEVNGAHALDNVHKHMREKVVSKVEWKAAHSVKSGLMPK